jgi:MFS family permease
MTSGKDIRYYFTADIISQLGSNISLLSLNWFLLEKTGSSEQVAILVLLSVLGSLCTCPFAGIIADRFNRKSILIYSNLIRGLAILTVAILLYSQNFNIYYLYILSIINGVGFNIYLPASKAFVQEITSREVLVRSNGFIEINVQISMLIAGALSGVIYEAFGIYTILVVDTMTFFIANLFLLNIQYNKVPVIRIYENFLKEFKNGIMYLTTRSSLLCFVLILLIPHVATITQNIVTPGYVFYHLNSDSVVYGIMNMSYGIGATITCLIFIFASSIYYNNFILRMSFIISILSLMTLISTNTVIIAYIATLFFGLANSSIKIILLSTMMRIVDSQYMGRVISVKNVVITLLQMCLSYPIGYAMDVYGNVTGYMFLELIMIIAFISYIYFLPKIKSLFVNSGQARL